jgi:hypothetical protein
VNRASDLKERVDVFLKFFFRNIKIFEFANNRFGGDVPVTGRQFQRLLAEKKPGQSPASTREEGGVTSGHGELASGVR